MKYLLLILPFLFSCGREYQSKTKEIKDNITHIVDVTDEDIPNIERIEEYYIEEKIEVCGTITIQALCSPFGGVFEGVDGCGRRSRSERMSERDYERFC